MAHPQPFDADFYIAVDTVTPVVLVALSLFKPHIQGLRGLLTKTEKLHPKSNWKRLLLLLFNAYADLYATFASLAPLAAGFLLIAATYDLYAQDAGQDAKLYVFCVFVGLIGLAAFIAFFSLLIIDDSREDAEGCCRTEQEGTESPSLPS